MAEDTPLLVDSQGKHLDYGIDGMNEKEELKDGTKLDGWKRFEQIFYLVAAFLVVITAFYEPLEWLNKALSSFGSVARSVYFIYFFMDEFIKEMYKQWYDMYV